MNSSPLNICIIIQSLTKFFFWPSPAKYIGCSVITKCNHSFAPLVSSSHIYSSWRRGKNPPKLDTKKLKMMIYTASPTPLSVSNDKGFPLRLSSHAALSNQHWLQKTLPFKQGQINPSLGPRQTNTDVAHIYRHCPITPYICPHTGLPVTLLPASPLIAGTHHSGPSWQRSCGWSSGAGASPMAKGRSSSPGHTLPTQVWPWKGGNGAKFEWVALGPDAQGSQRHSGWDPGTRLGCSCFNLSLSLKHLDSSLMF